MPQKSVQGYQIASIAMTPSDMLRSTLPEPWRAGHGLGGDGGKCLFDRSGKDYIRFERMNSRSQVARAAIGFNCSD